MIIILIVLVIVAILFLIRMGPRESGDSNNAKGFLQGAGLDTTSYKSTMDSTKKVLSDVQASRQKAEY